MYVHKTHGVNMLKKKGSILFLCLCFILCGCHHGIGSFDAGTLDVEQLMDRINAKSINGDWQFPIMKEEAWQVSAIQKAYALDVTKVQDAYSRSAILPAELGEITIFKATKEVDALLQQSVEKRIASLKQEWGNILYEADQVMQTVKEGRIGEYYYVIIGVDSQKVVNYIQSMD